MSQQNTSNQSGTLNMLTPQADALPHNNVQVPENDIDFEEQMKQTFEQFGKLAQDLLLDPTTLNECLEKLGGQRIDEADLHFLQNAGGLSAHIHDEPAKQDALAANGKKEEQDEQRLVLPTSTGSSSQSEGQDSWYYPGCGDDILMKALNSDLYKNLVTRKDASSYVDTLFPRLALPPEMLTTSEF